MVRAMRRKDVFATESKVKVLEEIGDCIRLSLVENYGSETLSFLSAHVSSSTKSGL